LFEGAELYRAESKVPETMEKYGHGTPNDWIERHLYTGFSWQGVQILLVVNVLLFGVIGVTVWAVQMMWIPITAAGIINGIGHYWGYRNYESADAATNIIPFGILIGGEELHNNHHTFATSAKLSSKWYEFDIGWLYIRILEVLHLAKVKKIAPTPKFSAAKSVADLDTLQAVIANRYDVMAKYAKTLKRAWQDEVAQLKGKNQLESGFLKSTKKLLQREPANLEAPQQQQLTELFEHSKALETMHQMRAELCGIWGRSNFSREQLLQQLQDWCARAETSGIKSLEEFSFRLRSYA
jgi:stearoyl-CoA desaturase (delta-9 desaturase)